MLSLISDPSCILEMPIVETKVEKCNEKRSIAFALSRYENGGDQGSEEHSGTFRKGKRDEFFQIKEKGWEQYRKGTGCPDCGKGMSLPSRFFFLQ